jgi:hypothetical protein
MHHFIILISRNHPGESSRELQMPFKGNKLVHSLTETLVFKDLLKNFKLSEIGIEIGILLGKPRAVITI